MSRLSRTCKLVLLGLSSILLILFITRADVASFFLANTPVVLTGGTSGSSTSSMADVTTGVDLGWYAPSQTLVNNLTNVVSAGTAGVYGFIYNSSVTPDDEYGAYNWCNMPHVRKTEYVVPDEAYELVYVELVSPHFLYSKPSSLTHDASARAPAQDAPELNSPFSLAFRSTVTTSAPPTRPTPSPPSRTHGTAPPTRGSTTSRAPSRTRRRPSPARAATPRPRASGARRATSRASPTRSRSRRRAGRARASSRRSRPRGSTTRGSTGPTSTASTATCSGSSRAATTTTRAGETESATA